MFALLTGCSDKKTTDTNIVALSEAGEINEIPTEPEADSYGFPLDGYEWESHEIQRNESLYLILDRQGVSPVQIYEIQQAASEHANLNRMIPGQSYRLYSSGGETVGMVWDLDALEYVVVDWSGEQVRVQRDQRELTTRQVAASGVIRSSLYETLQDEGLPDLLGSELADILAWEINFFALQRDDHFKVIYEELYVGDQYYALGDVKAVEFYHWGRTYEAFHFENGDRTGYFDPDGNSMQKALLQAPFRFSQRISSGFSNSRLHPIYNVRRPHHGVDYAAPTGTPILAAGDGVITEARYRGDNGNIVQVTHNSVYKTAYLHLSRFASGIRPGVRVQQGQVIGYVGQTGAATGPHLCYRLYINGSPVNSVTVELPASESLEQEYMTEFDRQRMLLQEKLSRIRVAQPFVTFNSAEDVYGRN